MNYIEKLNLINSHRNESKHAERIASQISYLNNISVIKGGIYDEQIEKGMDFVIDAVNKDGVITAKTVTDAEDILSPLSPVAKSYKQIFLAHAHIDMNWMWGYNETATITVDTFRTVLNLMNEYPDFTFAQSQASTYEIIEKYSPEMLDEIKQRIHEGRWEVTASEWVEPDKNIPDGESLTRQILESKKYLTGLLDIPADYLCIDFVPDTFGHNLNVPEVLCNAGVKYMYHCRGLEGDNHIYRYRSPSGKSTLNLREYGWYNGYIRTSNFECAADFCAENGVDTYLCVYGVGDHGGGPSRRDIERIIEYRSWPLTPDIRFGTMHEYFEILENSKTDFPVIDKELNFLFTGCYTTQSRIKMANRISETRINEAEELMAAAALLGADKRKAGILNKPWRNILFNHFHDIIPGSGTVETREYALGLFQDTLAYVNNYSNKAMRDIAANTDTTKIPFEDDDAATSEGAGAGYYQAQSESFRLTATERGRGPVRAVHIFNTTAYDRDEFCEITVWDYNYDHTNIAVTDADGKDTEFCISERGSGYWDHSFTKLLVRAKVPAFGYTTVIVKQNVTKTVIERDFPDPYTNNHIQPLNDAHINDAPFVLENEYIKAVFDRSTFHIISLTDKESGEELISEPSGYFRYIDENPKNAMTAWRVGNYMKVTDINKAYNVKVLAAETSDVYSYAIYEIKFSASVLRVKIGLKKNSRVIEYAVTADWNELPTVNERIPQLNFALPVSYTPTEKVVYDIPYGEIEREPLAHDVPALSFLNIRNSGENSVGIVTDTKYGYRFYNNCGSVNLIRSAYDPDPYPDRGIHNIRIGIMVGKSEDMKRMSDCFNHPLPFTAATRHEGKLPLENRALSVKGDVRVSCVKVSENGKGTTLRVYDVTGKKQKVSVSLAGGVSKAYITDSNEKVISEIALKDGVMEFSVEPYSTVTVTAE